MKLKTIKNVDESTWREFKALAARNSLNMGNMLERLIKEYSVHKKAVLGKILSGKEILTEEEADSMRKTLTKIRKERGFR